MRYSLIIALALALVPTQALAQSDSDFKQEVDTYVKFCRSKNVAETIEELDLSYDEKKLIRTLCIMYVTGKVDAMDRFLGD